MDASPILSISPRELASGGWYRSIAVTGVATIHELWISETGERAVYVVAPAGGPAGTPARWWRTAREFPAWDFTGTSEDRLNQQFEAEDVVVLEARAEVRAELS